MMTSSNNNWRKRDTGGGNDGQKSKRYQAELPVDTKTVSALIGRGGTNTKRVCRAAGNGTFIRAYNKSKGKDVRAKVSECDTFHIEAYSSESVKKAAALLRQDEQAFLKNGAPSRPQALVKCDGKDSAAVGTVIGSRGANIQRIQRFVGDGCYIVHKKETGGFVVTCNTQRSLAMAVTKLRSSISDYHMEQKEWRKRQKFARESNQQDTRSNNSFAGLVEDSDEESDDDTVDRATMVKQRYQQRVQTRKLDRFSKQMDGAFRKAYSNGGIRDRKTHEQKRWEVRKEMGKKTNRETGAPLYEPYEFRTKEGKLVRCAGTSAVPWSEVDAEMKRLQHIEDIELEKARGLGEKARQDKLLKEMDSTSEESFPSLPDKKKTSRSKVEELAANSKVLKQCPALVAAIGDLASEQSIQRKCVWDNGVSARCLKVDDVTEAQIAHQKQKMATEQDNKSKMLTLGRDNLKSSEEDLGGAASQVVDLSYLDPAPKRNVTLSIAPRRKKIVSWADAADTDSEVDDEFFDDEFFGGTE